MENVGQHGAVGASLSHPVMTLLVSVLPALFVHTMRTSFSLLLVTERCHSVTGNYSALAFALADVSVYSLVCRVILCNLDVQTQHVSLNVSSLHL